RVECGGAGMHFAWIRFDADVTQSRVGEGGREIAWAAADVEQGPAGRWAAGGVAPQIGDHRRGVVGQCAVEPGGVALLVAELVEQPQRPGQRRPPGEEVGCEHQADPTYAPA